MTASFARLATVTMSTLRPPPVVGGKRGAPQPYLSDLRGTPLAPVDAHTRMRMGLETPHEVWTTFIEGDVDIREGDTLVVNGAEYAVQAVASWPGPRAFVQVFVEEAKG